MRDKNYKQLEQLTDPEFEVVLLASETVEPEFPAFLHVCRAGILTAKVRHLELSALSNDCSAISFSLPSGVIRRYPLSASGSSCLKLYMGRFKKGNLRQKLFPTIDKYNKETLRSKWYMILRRCGLPRSKSLVTLSWRSVEERRKAEDDEVIELIRLLERTWVPGLRYKGREAPVPPGYAPLEVIPRASAISQEDRPKAPPQFPSDPKLVLCIMPREGESHIEPPDADSANNTFAG